MQAQFMALADFRAEGTSTIDERLFENRFMHVSELLRMGADIQLNGNIATIIGEKGNLERNRCYGNEIYKRHLLL